ncbi:hypothetical protein J2S55_000821 [Streptosporangium brasiliense]|uniref:Uncharacterized protein n=1 Tax=Streptosporangium brasiliense TaxID=47480 RepID=A0ABT9QY77_9ACTN|nr:hypothetical protein [Streptosporangium brasiliense]
MTGDRQVGRAVDERLFPPAAGAQPLTPQLSP